MPRTLRAIRECILTNQNQPVSEPQTELRRLQDILRRNPVALIILVILAIGVLGLLNNLGSGPSGSGSEPSGSYNTMPLEQKLGSIDAGHRVDKDDITVKRFRYLLDSLHDASGVDPETIADKVVWARNNLRDKYGRKDESALDVMEGLNNAYKAKDLTNMRGTENFNAILAFIVVSVGDKWFK